MSLCACSSQLAGSTPQVLLAKGKPAGCVHAKKTPPGGRSRCGLQGQGKTSTELRGNPIAFVRESVRSVRVSTAAASRACRETFISGAALINETALDFARRLDRDVRF